MASSSTAGSFCISPARWKAPPPSSAISMPWAPRWLPGFRDIRPAPAYPPRRQYRQSPAGPLPGARYASPRGNGPGPGRLRPSSHCAGPGGGARAHPGRCAAGLLNWPRLAAICRWNPGPVLAFPESPRHAIFPGILTAILEIKGDFMQIGIVGLGRMGANIGRRLMKQGPQGGGL